ncbi:MAG: thiosulfohydrolase SoxB [Rhodospirillales bacterium]|nr:thiosulfohydrolase SoxB [Alphaproteobacteria bacterium]MBL6948213.1 thiosulfohydrolase SoxB [Rhodospirillales bacterium]
MLDRRQFLQVAAATAAITGVSGGLLPGALARQKITQKDLLKFDSVGQVTLLNFTDCHAQLVPLFFREPSINIGVGDVHGLPPHLTGKELLNRFGLKGGSMEAYAFSSDDYVNLAKTYGRIGGMDRMATLVKAIRAERPNNTLLFDGGDTWQGSYTSLQTSGKDMVDVMNTLGVDAMTAHWEFTYGAERVKELIGHLKFPFLAGNVRDTEWEEEVFPHTQMYERGGVKIGVIGQAFPYTPVANPRYMIPTWSFGIREKAVRQRVAAARKAGAELVVLLSHDGFDVDRKLASRVDGIDVILTGHTHDAIPDVIKVNNTLLVASGSHGKFLARLDLDVKGGKVTDFRFKLIPILSDVIEPDKEMAALIKKIRAPHEKAMRRVVGRTDSLLYRRGSFNGTFDDMICQALLEERDAEISLSPGFRWGGSLIPGQDITVEDIFNQTAITYPNAYRSEFTGSFLKEILEDVADNLFNTDPYYQQGGDMVRVGGMGYSINPHKPMGSRIGGMTLLKTGKPIDPAKTYVVSGWASVNEGTKGPPVYDVVTKYVEKKKVINIPPNQNIRILKG